MSSVCECQKPAVPCLRPLQIPLTLQLDVDDDDDDGGCGAVKSDRPSSLSEHNLTSFLIVGLSLPFIHMDTLPKSLFHMNETEQTVGPVFCFRRIAC